MTSRARIAFALALTPVVAAVTLALNPAQASSCPAPTGHSLQRLGETFQTFVYRHAFPANGEPNAANVISATVCAEGVLTNDQYTVVNSGAVRDGWQHMTLRQLGIKREVWWGFYGP